MHGVLWAASPGCQERPEMRQSDSKATFTFNLMCPITSSCRLGTDLSSQRHKVVPLQSCAV